MGYGPFLERGATHLRMLFSLGVLPISTRFPPTFQKAELHNHCWPASCSAEAWAPTTQQHPCGSSELLFITGVRHPPPPALIWVVCGTLTDVHTHPRTYTHLLTPKGPDKHLVERMLESSGT